MGRRIVECVPNFSEGRDAAKVDSIEEVIARGPGVAVLGKTMDRRPQPVCDYFRGYS